MTAPRERLAHTDLDRRTYGFFFRAFEEFEDLVLREPTVSEAKVTPDLAEHKSMRDQLATGFVSVGFDFLESTVKDTDIKRMLREVKDVLMSTSVIHTYFGEIDVQDAWGLSRGEPFIEPQLVPNETPFFMVSQYEGDESRYIIAPEQWLRNGVSHDSNHRIEALASLVHTASFMYGYVNRAPIKGRIILAKAQGVGLPSIDDQEEFMRGVEMDFVNSLAQAGTNQMRVVLKQAAEEISRPPITLSEGVRIGFPTARYVPTQEPFRRIFYK